jgi:hypothetical protein
MFIHRFSPEISDWFCELIPSAGSEGLGTSKSIRINAQ